MAEIVKSLEIAHGYQVGLHTKEMQMDKPQESYKGSGDYSTQLHFLMKDRERFELEDLLGAEAEVLGGGSLGTSYKAMLPGGINMVVKRFKQPSYVEKEDFDAHMRLMGNLSHPNLLPLVAFNKKEHILFITDFAVNVSLASHLHATVKDEPDEPRLDWPTRLKIIQGVARGLAYLYQELPHLSLPHGLLKSSHVLLDDNFNPLLADYALVPILNKEHAQLHMVAYKSPEFTQHECVTKKTDIWCLGILILEIMTGKAPKNYLEQGRGGEGDLKTLVNSVGWEEWTDKVFDKDMNWTKNNEIEMIDLMEIGIHCCESDTTKRWSMRKAIEKILGLKEGEDDEDDF
ncbi:hypothetical protein L1887_27734 [Cichorium endivia]|nr:hypothetical protein L1887_27734 [Cichorium endivia]